MTVSRETPAPKGDEPKTQGDKGRRLGRGLEALLGRQTPAANAAVETSESPLRELPVADIHPNPFQPRTDFKPEEIEDLKASLAENGLLQPITVRPAGSAGYQLIAGERRLRAAVALGWTKITCIVREIDDRAALTLALVENLQRSDLNPIEEAEGYQRLATEFQLSHEEIARIVGKNRTTIVNSLRLLGLPTQVRELVQKGTLSAGHGRAILGLPSEDARAQAAQIAVENGFSVRSMENYVKALTIRHPESEPQTAEPSQPKVERWEKKEYRRVENTLRTYLQTDVRVEQIGPLSANLIIRFYGTSDLDRLMQRILGSTHTDEAP